MHKPPPGGVYKHLPARYALPVSLGKASYVMKMRIPRRERTAQYAGLGPNFEKKRKLFPDTGFFYKKVVYCL
jgi:hypothetical protein